MSKKIEKILDLLVNEETDRAEALLHDLVVEKARYIYEGLVNEEDDEDDTDQEEVDEAFGGDMKSDFVQEVEADKEDIGNDEQADGEAGIDGMEIDDGESDEFGGDEFGDEFGAEEEEDMEDVVLDVRDQLEQLRADFESLLGGEDEMGMDDMGIEPEVDGMELEPEMGEVGIEDEDDLDEMRYMEGLEEATKLQDPVSDPGMKKEGQLAGTGKHSKTGATGTQSPYTKAPSKSLQGESPVDWTKGGTGGEYTGPAGGDTTSAKDDTPSSNIDVSHTEENKLDLTGSQTGQNTEGNFSGTGKNSKKGATNTKSPLSNAPKKP